MLLFAIRALALFTFCFCMSHGANAVEARPASDDPVLEARVQAITSELRCLVCQNQTIADSNAGLAFDLRNQVREMLAQGRTNAEIIEFMTQRYGDFVLYRPPVKASTWLLWFGPFLMAISGIVILLVVLRRRSQLPADHFDPDPQDINPIADSQAPTQNTSHDQRN